MGILPKERWQEAVQMEKQAMKNPKDKKGYIMAMAENYCAPPEPYVKRITNIIKIEEYGKMTKFLRLNLVLLLVILIAGCGVARETEIERKENTTYSSDIERNINKIILTWYKENYYEYDECNEPEYSFRVIDKNSKVYDQKCYLVVMYFEGKQYMDFAVNVQSGNLYLCYEDGITFIPLNDLAIIDDKKYAKQGEKIIDTVFNSQIEDIIYCDTIKKNGDIYFLLGQFINSEFQDMYLVHAETQKVYKWNLRKDVLENIDE